MSVVFLRSQWTHVTRDTVRINQMMDLQKQPNLLSFHSKMNVKWHFSAKILLTSLTLVKKKEYLYLSFWNNVPIQFLSFHTPNSLKINLFGKVICGLLVSGAHFILKLNQLSLL